MMIKVKGVTYTVVAWASKTYTEEGGIVKTTAIHPVVIVKGKAAKTPYIFKVEEIEEIDV